MIHQRTSKLTKSKFVKILLRKYSIFVIFYIYDIINNVSYDTEKEIFRSGIG